MFQGGRFSLTGQSHIPDDTALYIMQLTVTEKREANVQIDVEI